MSGPAEDDHPNTHALTGPGEAGDDPAPDDAPPDISAWIATAPREACPACGAPGAVRLGGGVFCPSCRQTTTAAGYVGPALPPRDDDPE